MTPQYASSLQLHMKEFHSVNFTARAEVEANMTNDKVSFLVSQGQLSSNEQARLLMSLSGSRS